MSGGVAHRTHRTQRMRTMPARPPEASDQPIVARANGLLMQLEAAAAASRLTSLTASLGSGLLRVIWDVTYHLGRETLRPLSTTALGLRRTEMTMVPRLILALAITIILVEPTIAAPLVKLRVLTEDAYVNQCWDGICTTVQVTRETFSNGDTDTLILVSAEDESGNPIFPPFNTHIDNSLFVVNKQGTQASVSHPMAFVTWTADGLYTEEANSTRKVVDKRENAFTEPHAFRLTEKEHIHGAAAEGIAGTLPTAIAINTEALSSGGFANSFITIRRTTRIDRVLPGQE